MILLCKRQKQEDHKFKSCLRYIERPYYIAIHRSIGLLASFIFQVVISLRVIRYMAGSRFIMF